MDSRTSELLKQAEKMLSEKQFINATMNARKVIKKYPENIAANIILLKSAEAKNNVNDVLTIAEHILTIEPKNTLALQAKLQCLKVLEHHFLAINVADQLLELQPDNVELLFSKGLFCLSAGKIAEAEHVLHRCIELNDDNSFVLLNLGHVYKAKGESKKASDFYKQFIENNSDSYAVGYWSLADLKDYKFSVEESQHIEQLLKPQQKQTQTITIGNQALLMFALARAYEQHNDFSAAFKVMAQANQIIAKYRPFKAEQFAMLVKGFIADLNDINELADYKNEFSPIFIVGMPRSGTTLVEQILASHSSVHTTDELPYIERIGLELEHTGGYIQNLKRFDKNKASALAERYIEQVSPYFNDNQDADDCHVKVATPKIFIDKNPNNFLHIALIKYLFPNARIVNVIRDPLDNAMSVFKQYFSNGHDYSYSIPSIMFYWQGYLSLMFHWKNLFGEQIYNLSYEALVAEPEQKIRELLSYCQLDFEEQCLTFYESKRMVLTPSVSQVKQPINNKSVGSWKNYQPQLAPALAQFKMIQDKAEELLDY